MTSADFRRRRAAYEIVARRAAIWDASPVWVLVVAITGIPAGVMMGWIPLNGWLAGGISVLLGLTLIMALGSKAQLPERARVLGLTCEQCGALLVDVAARAAFPEGCCPTCRMPVWKAPPDQGAGPIAPSVDFVTRAASVRRGAGVRGLIGFLSVWAALLVFTFGILFAIRHGRAVPRWSLQAFMGACALLFVAYGTWIVFWRDRAADRAGLRCPWCGTQFNLDGNGEMLSAGNCPYCGQVVAIGPPRQ